MRSSSNAVYQKLLALTSPPVLPVGETQAPGTRPTGWRRFLAPHRAEVIWNRERPRMAVRATCHRQSPGPIRLIQIVRDARRLVDSELQLRDASIELELADLPAVSLNVRAMESAVVNLLTNAAQSDERAVTIKVASRHEENDIILRVEDSGAGIPESDLERIFDPFFTARQGEGGTGLGLSQVHATVTEHGGTIDVQSERGKGTAVTVRLPVETSGDAA